MLTGGKRGIIFFKFNIRFKTKFDLPKYGRFGALDLALRPRTDVL